MGIYVPQPIKPPTGSELTVLFWVVVIIVLGFGLVCLYFGYRAPADRAEEAAKLIRGGYAFIAGGVVLALVRRYFS
ncbi:MAG: hypothetical protein JW993_14475 [Sedimentisphaerales bacterium]|nr:hypothetical protein [Sedimentisphaerales bacterium]